MRTIMAQFELGLELASSCWKRHNAERDMSSAVSTEHAQSLPWRFSHGRFDLGQHFRRSLQRTADGAGLEHHDAAA